MDGNFVIANRYDVLLGFMYKYERVHVVMNVKTIHNMY